MGTWWLLRFLAIANAVAPVAFVDALVQGAARFVSIHEQRVAEAMAHLVHLALEPFDLAGRVPVHNVDRSEKDTNANYNKPIPEHLTSPCCLSRIIYFLQRF